MSQNPAKVLLVEDSGFFRRALTTNLEGVGFAVTGATNGEEAIKIAKKERFDVIILDLHMPRMDGMLTLRILNGRPETRGTPVVVVTANDKTEDRMTVMQLGAIYRPKGNLTFDALLETIQSCLAITGKEPQQPQRLVS
jgi:two-component system, OmpR family, phosphate regulon response regulator PhoB